MIRFDSFWLILSRLSRFNSVWLGSTSLARFDSFWLVLTHFDLFDSFNFFDRLIFFLAFCRLKISILLAKWKSKQNFFSPLSNLELFQFLTLVFFSGYKCLDCHKFFMKKTAWKLHQVKRNHNSKILYCRFCHWTFREKYQFDQHAQDYPPRQCVPMSLKKNSENSENDEFSQSSQCLKITRKKSHF